MVKELKKNNMAFKMKGSPMQRNFGVGATPVKRLSFTKISKAIGGSKFGKTVVGKVLKTATGTVGKIQDTIASVKNKFVDKTTSKDPIAVESDIDTSTEPVNNTLEKPEHVGKLPGVNLEKVKVGPVTDFTKQSVAKRVTRRTYAKRRKRK